MNKIIIISIKPKYVKKIIDGLKSIELRSKNMNLKKDDVVFIYTTYPTSKIQCFFYVKEVIEDNINNMWNLHKDEINIDKKEFDNYLKNKNICYGIKFGRINIFMEEFIDGKDILNLSNLRKYDKNFKPPQFYKILKKEDKLYKFLIKGRMIFSKPTNNKNYK